MTLPPQHPLLPLYAMFQFSSTLMPSGVPTNSAMAAGQTTPNLLQFLTVHVMSVIFHTNMDSTNTFTFLSLLHTYTFLLGEFCACMLSLRCQWFFTQIRTAPIHLHFYHCCTNTLSCWMSSVHAYFHQEWNTQREGWRQSGDSHHSLELRLTLPMRK